MEKAEKNIFLFWTGDNKMSSDRKRCYESILKTCGVSVQLITEDNLKKFVVQSDPIHDAYKFLSFTHRADYLIAYFSYHYGSGFMGIKNNVFDWNPFFDDLNNSSFWINGYQELGAVHVAAKEQFIKDSWKMLIGNGQYIVRPKTQLSLERLEAINRTLDLKFEELKENPAVHPQEVFGFINPASGKKSLYPLEWAEIGGTIFQPLIYKYSNFVLKKLPIGDFITPYR